MPLREYEAAQAPGCALCGPGFERLEPLHAPPRSRCPRCGGNVRRRLAAPVVGRSQSGLDQQARQAGFHKLKRRGRGEYEKLY